MTDHFLPDYGFYLLHKGLRPEARNRPCWRRMTRAPTSCPMPLLGRNTGIWTCTRTDLLEGEQIPLATPIPHAPPVLR